MNILFLGGDKRYEYMIEALSKKHFVSSIGFDNLGNNINESNLKSLNLADFDIVLFPITGINDKMEIKTLKGTIVLPEEPFYRLKYTKSCPIFFTGLKTNKLLYVAKNQSKINTIITIITINHTGIFFSSLY